MKVAIQGEAASFHDVAAHEFFGDEIELVCCSTFAEAFAALASGKADAAMLAVENSNYGPIQETLDLLDTTKPTVLGEVTLTIHQQLIGLPGSKLEDITEVHSHPVALAQCSTFLDHTLPNAKRVKNPDTAGAAADIYAWGKPNRAAIASKAAAELYGLQILAENIETDKDNKTRFVGLEHAQKLAPTARSVSP